MSLKPPAPMNSGIGIAYLVILVAAFMFAYNKNAQLRTFLGGKA